MQFEAAAEAQPTCEPEPTELNHRCVEIIPPAPSTPILNPAFIQRLPKTGTAAT
jgi:hypothetical protein